MNLCLLSDVKGLLDIAQDETTKDDLLRFFISSVSRQIENWLHRECEKKTRTEYFDADGNVYVLKAYPITSVSSVKNATDLDWGNPSTIDADNYDTHNGILYIEEGWISEGFKGIKIVYTGGLAQDPEALRLGDYADISLAATMQVVALYNNRSNFGLTNATLGGDNASWQYPGLLPAVKRMLRPYRRKPVMYA